MSTVGNCCHLLSAGFASSSPAIPWLPGIQSRVVFLARLLSMLLKSAVPAELLWIALRSEWLSVQTATAA